MIRLLVVLFVGVPGTAVLAWQIIWAVLRRSPNADCVCQRVPRRWSELMLWAAGAKVVIENDEVIDEGRPQVIVANHVSWYDVFALAAYIPGPYLFVAKKEVRRFPLLGRAIADCGHIFIDRKNHQGALDSLADVRASLEQRNPTIVMFPEGTRSASGELQRFKKGAFVLALQARADIVPVAITGSRAVMKKGSLFIHPGTITVRFGEPIPVASLTLQDRDELMRDSRDALSALLDAGPQANT